ncbi:hypothetical protein TruAng_004853 [Truncatella angustata]|nr:hypothetical protein TruAng_004853 [Truncatella angustata]
MKVRKKNCDGKHPACSQCLSSNRRCEGYPDILFVPFVSTPPMLAPKISHVPPSSKRTQQCAARALPPLALQPTYALTPAQIITTQADSLAKQLPSLSYNQSIGPSLSGTLQEKIFLILRNYVPYSELQHDIANAIPNSPRVCGSWATALPELTRGATGALGECLDSAINVLALSITAYRTGKEMFRPISSGYEHTLRLLRRDLQQAGRVYKSEQIATVMCLTLLEVLSPTNPHSWLVHVDGVSELMRSSSPEFFSTNVHHTLFIGFRPLLILKAFILRKATFLVHEDWIEKPFQHHHAAPLQNLLSLAATIPGVLEKFDILKDEPPNTTMVAAKEALAELVEIRSNLQTWSDSFSADSSVPLYWQRTPKNASECHKTLLWFQDLSGANVFIYLWSFQIICLSHIQSLLARCPELQKLDVTTPENTAELRNFCIELSIKIYQSMEYVTQEGFMLYGLLSAGFPLYTARKAMELDERGRALLQRLGKHS